MPLINSAPLRRVWLLLLALGLLTGLARGEAAAQGSPLGTLLARVEVAAEGWTEVSGAELAAAGVALAGTDAARLRLVQGGAELPLQLSRDAGALRPEDTLGFYVLPETDRFRATDTLQLWLAPEGERGVRLGSRQLPPIGSQPLVTAGAHTLRLAPEAFYDSLHGGRGGDHWFWRDLRYLTLPPYPTERVEVEAPLAGASGGARLLVALQGVSGGAHGVSLWLNGQAIGSVGGQGATLMEATLDLPAGLLREGSNLLELRSTEPGGSLAISYLDEIELLYSRSLDALDAPLSFAGEAGARRYRVGQVGEARLLDVSEPHAPVLLQGARSFRPRLFMPTLGDGPLRLSRAAPLTEPPERFLHFADEAAAPRRYHVAPAGETLRAVRVERATAPVGAGAGADLIIIAPAPFHAALAPLVAHRTAQGLRVRVVDVQAVYDGWSHSRLDPGAIQAFLREAFAAWPRPAPRFVLLVGDGSIDFHHTTGEAPPYPIPPFLAPVDPWLGESASDTHFARVSDSRLPDLAVGRIPARTAEEVAIVVAKTIAYETAPPTSAPRALLVADDDPRRTFVTSVEGLATLHLPAWMAVQRFYFDPSGGAGLYSDAAALRADLHDALRGGAELVLFSGHSSYHQWAQESFLHEDAVAERRRGGPRAHRAGDDLFHGGLPHDALAERGVAARSGGAGRAVVRLRPGGGDGARRAGERLSGRTLRGRGNGRGGSARGV